jgi:hypothetical protein
VNHADPDPLLATAETVAALLDAAQAPCVLIGALALAVHNHPRATNHVDLAIAVPPKRLSSLAEQLRIAGFVIELRLPDADDPLGGVIDVPMPDAQLIHIINFDNSPAGGFPRLVREAIPRSLPVGGGVLRVVDLPMLVAFKLYAGGLKSATDILALLEKNDVDRAALREHCVALSLGAELDEVLAWETGRPKPR